MNLPVLKPNLLTVNKNYLQNITLALSALQRGFLPKHPKQWQYGLEISMRGICTQVFEAGGQEHRALLDLAKNKVRFDGRTWTLEGISSQQLFEEFKDWAGKYDAKLEQPEFTEGSFDAAEAGKYAEALWWMYDQFAQIKQEFTTGDTAPIYLYAHHFDLALVWFPWGDERQVSIGFSTGDNNVKEPYIYMTIYPLPETVNEFWLEKLPAESYWQTDGFTGAVLPYSRLQQSKDAPELLRKFAGPFSSYAVATGF